VSYVNLGKYLDTNATFAWWNNIPLLVNAGERFVRYATHKAAMDLISYV
jgi:hypothetical protein